MRVLATVGLVLGVAMMAAPLVLPRLGALAPERTAAAGPSAGAFSPLAAGRGMVALVGGAAALPAPAPACATDCGPVDTAPPPRAELAPLPQVAARRTGPGAKFVKVGP